MTQSTILKNQLVVLLDERGQKFFVHAGNSMVKVRNLGAIDSDRLEGKAWGDNVDISGQVFIILEPSILDQLESLRRKAQIILPRDSAQIIINCNIRSGSIVVEVGAGSGALTLVLASFVAPSGSVVSYEERQDFADIALYNLNRSGLSDLVEIKVRDASQCIDEKNADAVVIDIPDPWNVLENTNGALRIGGYLSSFLPTFNQVEQMVKALRVKGYMEIRTIETIQREIVVHDMGTRPSYDMLGHTGYLTFARKVK